MPQITDRMLELLRLMHGGARLRVEPKGAARLDITHIAPTVRRLTLTQLEASGMITLEAESERWEITDHGRDAVRVRDHVDDFIREATA